MENELNDSMEDKFTASSAPPCLACEALIPDALDGVLTAGDQAWFDQHLDTCATCSEMVADAQRGAAWLEMLKQPRPEPTAALFTRILAETSGQEHLHLLPQPVVAAHPLLQTNVLPFRRETGRGMPLARLLETRLAMTAAMAFFSIALTLNLTGVHLRAADLRAGNVKNTWYQATAQVHRSYDNWRVVRVLTSRMDALRDDALRGDALRNEEEPSGTQPEPMPEKPQGSSHRDAPASGDPVWMTAVNSVPGGIA